MRKKIAVSHHLYVAPVTYGWLPETSPFEVMNDLSAVNALKLRSDEISCALITPIDYGRESSDYVIVPDVAVSSRGDSGAIRLFFKSGLQQINTVAVNIGSTSEIVLTRIILAERYDTEPKFLPMMPDMDAMFKKADAALLVGNDVLAVQDHPEFIDLVDEWEDLTELPYTHGFWGFKPGALTMEEMQHIRFARDEGIKNISTIANKAALGKKQAQAELEEYLKQFSYILDEEVSDSISEFFRYAFFYRVIEDIPDIRIFNEGTGSDSEVL